MKFRSPAKVNLYLEVLSKRPDGYHEIQTLMQRVDLSDELEIDLGGRGIRLVSEGAEVPEGMDNLACRAARIFCEEFGIRGDLRIRLKKKIPVAAGLGGGSSNAATVLMGLNELLQAGGEGERLMALGAKIGADVPFFIFQKPALARGIGREINGGQLARARSGSSCWFPPSRSPRHGRTRPMTVYRGKRRNPCA